MPDMRVQGSGQCSKIKPAVESRATSEQTTGTPGCNWRCNSASLGCFSTEHLCVKPALPKPTDESPTPEHNSTKLKTWSTHRGLWARTVQLASSTKSTTAPQDRKDAPKTEIFDAPAASGGISPQTCTTCPPGMAFPTPALSHQIMLSKTTETVAPLLRHVHVGTNKFEKHCWSAEPNIGFDLPNFCGRHLPLSGIWAKAVPNHQPDIYIYIFIEILYCQQL